MTNQDIFEERLHADIEARVVVAVPLVCQLGSVCETCIEICSDDMIAKVRKTMFIERSKHLESIVAFMTSRTSYA